MWIFYALLTSFLNCVYYFGNQMAKMPPKVFMFYRGLVPVAVLLPFLCVVEFIYDWRFYALCSVQGLIISFIDYRNFRAMRIWGAETISSIHSLNISFIFVLWMILRPSTMVEYWRDPMYFAGILLSLCGAMYALSSFKRSWRNNLALKYMFLFIVGSALCDIFNKLCMGFVDSEKLVYGSYFYILITSFVIMLTNFWLYCRENEKLSDLVDWKYIRYVPIMLILILSIATKNFSMFSTPNPSFAKAIMYTYIVWIMLVAKILQKYGISCQHRGIPRKKVLLLLASVLLLILLQK